MTMALWQGTNNVDMNGLKSLVRDWEVSNARIHCPGLLGNLAWMASLDESFDVGSKLRPVVVGGYSPDRLLLTRMITMVKEIDHQRSLLGRDQWTRIIRVRHLAEEVHA